MVRIIPASQQRSTHERFANAFSNAGQGASQALGQYNERKEQQQAQQMQQQSQQMQQQQMSAFSKQLGLEGLEGLHPDIQKMVIQEKLKGNNEKNLFEQKNRNDLELQKHKYEMENEMQANKLRGQPNPNQKAEDSKNIAQKAFDTIVDITNKKNVGMGSSFFSLFNGDVAKDIGKFESTLGGLEQALTHFVTSGVLSDAKFKYIKDNLLPSPSDRQETIRGKLEGIAQILDLNDSKLKASNGDNNSLEDIWND